MSIKSRAQAFNHFTSLALNFRQSGDHFTIKKSQIPFVSIGATNLLFSNQRAKLFVPCSCVIKFIIFVQWLSEFN